MKSDKVTVTLYACHTAEALAKACRTHGETRWYPCTVGHYFHCPLAVRSAWQCAMVKAKDWESVMVEADDANAD